MRHEVQVARSRWLSVMAYKNFTLPPLKIVHRPAYGKKVVKVLQRVVVDEENCEDICDQAKVCGIH